MLLALSARLFYCLILALLLLLTSQDVCCYRLHYFWNLSCCCWFCIHAVACFPTVVGGHAIAVIHAVALCWRIGSFLRQTLLALNDVACIPAVAGLPLVPDVSMLLLSLVLLTSLVMLAFLLMHLSLLLLAFLLLLSLLAVDDIPADPGNPILTVVFTLYILYCTMRHTVLDYQAIVLRL
jgi:hypothetical protein